jgi:pyruvate dehydrogenase E1 component beta subunit
MPLTRQLTCAQAINEATAICMERDPSVYITGLGVPDPKGIFGTTLGLQQRFGERRVFDMPCSENAMTGVAIGSALAGMRPIMTHQRVDFALLALEQLVNQAANWHYMFGGQMKMPLVIRMLIGRGWGQGPQHSQNLHAWFAHIPGLKVAMPATPHDAKGMLITSIEDDNPVIFLEHRWLHGVKGDVPEGHYQVPLGKARIAREGHDITLVCTSYMLLEGLQAAELLADEGISVEVIDLRSIKPFDNATIRDSVRKTGRLLAADTGWLTGGFGAEIVASITESAWPSLKCAPRRIALPDCPTPTSHALTEHYYPRTAEICSATRDMLDRPPAPAPPPDTQTPHDVPSPTFKGPF